MSEAVELAKLLESGVKRCKLSTCPVEFKPKVDWQEYCCEDHARKARALRRKQRVKEALSLLKEKEG